MKILGKLMKAKKTHMYRFRWKMNYNSSSATILLAAIIGSGTGLLTILFRKLIGWSETGFSLTADKMLGFLPFSIWMIFIPAIAGLFVGLISHYLAKEIKGTGIPEVMEAVAINGGIIRKRVVPLKMLAAAFSIGSGASVGKEGPIVQIGSGVGSVIGQKFMLNSDKLKTCVACGAAAGIAATFNAPIAGVIFAQEVILGEFVSTAFVSIVISSVAASVIAQVFIGDIPAFLVQAYTLNNPIELLFYALLGMITALIGLFFVRLIYKTEDIFNRLEISPWIKPAIGGLLVGIIGLKFPEIMGVGYHVIENTFTLNYLFITLLLLTFLKILATSLTLGSGHSGGVFAPSLFIGATLGGTIGIALHQLFPSIVTTPGAYSIVGMGALVAGTTQAPIAAVLMIFEMTRDYRMILPLMIAVVFSTLIFSYLNKGESVYTMKLIRRGVNIKQGKDLNIMRKITASEVMSNKVDTCKDTSKVSMVIKMMHNSKHNGFPVLNEHGDLVGIITLQDIREAPVKGIMEEVVANLMTPKLIVSHEDETLDEVFHKLSIYDLGHLPVVKKDNPKKLIGIITRSDIIKAYDKKLIISSESAK